MMRCLSRAVCLVLGSILGAGCQSWVNSETPVEYGMPSARYILDGVVTARTTGRPIPGIRLFLSRGAHPDSALSATSGADGRWQLDLTTLPCGDSCGRLFPCDGTCGLVTTDEDGPNNGGAFAPGTVRLELTQTMPGNGHWLFGTFEQHGISVSLDPQTREE
jgi:putative lipoprotein (rSAM/lipoprotein system)